jgi:GTPase SAR1 family protein
VAALIVFDLTSIYTLIIDENSFDQLHTWLDLVKEVRGEDSKLYIIGNKRDLKEARVITT